MKELPDINWQQLIVTELEIDYILRLNLIQKLSLEMLECLILGESKRNNSFLKSELIMALLCLFFFVPLVIIFANNYLASLEQFRALMIVIISSVFLSFILLLVLNLAIWRLAKKFKRVGKVLRKITQHNSQIKHLETLTEFGNFSEFSLVSDQITYITGEDDFDQIEASLQLTKNGLLNNLKLEKLFLTNQIH